MDLRIKKEQPTLVAKTHFIMIMKVSFCFTSLLGLFLHSNASSKGSFLFFRVYVHMLWLVRPRPSVGALADYGHSFFPFLASRKSRYDSALCE